VKKVGRISIARREEPGRTLESKQGRSSKLIKMDKDDVGARRDGVVALGGDKEGRDTVEEMLREKLLKEKRSSFLNHPLGEGQSRPVALPSIEEYSFDYDGSIFPPQENQHTQLAPHQGTQHYLQASSQASPPLPSIQPAPKN
jgi:hypothetical protein